MSDIKKNKINRLSLGYNRGSKFGLYLLENWFWYDGRGNPHSKYIELDGFYCLECNKDVQLGKLVKAEHINKEREEGRDRWDGMMQFDIHTLKCPVCGIIDTQTTYEGTIDAKSDMQLYGYRGANYGT